MPADPHTDPPTQKNEAFLLWFANGRYTYVFGSDKDDALRRYMENHVRGIARVDSVKEYRDPPPPHLYQPGFPGDVWPDTQNPNAPGQPLYSPDQWSQK